MHPWRWLRIAPSFLQLEPPLLEPPLQSWSQSAVIMKHSLVFAQLSLQRAVLLLLEPHANAKAADANMMVASTFRILSNLP